MKTEFSHVVFAIDPANRAFYGELMSFLGWATIMDEAEILGVGNFTGPSLWFASGVNGAKNDYDGPGVNHVAIGAQSQADINAVVAYLAERGVEALFETPRHRPEFSMSPEETYYQVMFESPDRILFEVVYTGPKQ